MAGTETRRAKRGAGRKAERVTGTAYYYPELNDKQPEADCVIEYSYGGLYNLWTFLELKGRGIKSRETGERGHRYVVTGNAVKMLEKKYSLAQRLFLD
jgi:hypothetical protein